MSGRPKIKVHIYSTDDCSYIRSFDTMTDFRNYYWPNDIGKRPVFQKNELGHDYEIIEEAEIIALTSRPGREPIRLILAINKSSYCKKQDQGDDNTPIQVFNLRGEMIAEFASQRLAYQLLNIPQSRISNHLLKRDKCKKSPNKVVQGGLIFKYKE